MTEQEQEEYKDLTEESKEKESNMFDFCMPSISIDDIFDRSLLPSL